MFLPVLVDSVAPAGADKPPPVPLYQPDSFPNLRHEPGERECPTGSGGFLELGCFHWSRFPRAEVQCWRNCCWGYDRRKRNFSNRPLPSRPFRFSPRRACPRKDGGGNPSLIPAPPPVVLADAGTHSSFPLPLPLSSRMRGPIPIRCSRAEPAPVKTGAGTHPSFLLPTCHPAQPPMWHSKRSAALSPPSFL